MPTRTRYEPNPVTGRVNKITETTAVDIDSGVEIVTRRNITILDPDADAVGIQAGRDRVAAESAALDAQQAELDTAQAALPEGVI
jgi:hypothetical protein